MSDTNDDEGFPDEESGSDRPSTTESEASDHKPPVHEPPPQSDSSQRTKYLVMGAGIAVLAIAGFFIVSNFIGGSGSGELEALAEETCSALDGSVVLTAGLLVGVAVSAAENLGYSGPELGDEMRRQCPGIMAALDNIGDEQDRRDALPDGITISTNACGRRGASGRVSNRNDVTVDVTIRVQYLDRNGTIIEDGLDFVDGLRSGESALWDDKRFSDMSGVDKCRTEVGSARES